MESRKTVLKNTRALSDEKKGRYTKLGICFYMNCVYEVSI